MIGAVIVLDNSTGGKRREKVMTAHLMSASVTEMTWKFADVVVMETDICAADRRPGWGSICVFFFFPSGCR